jgi:Domain of unknown function (DUF4365)
MTPNLPAANDANIIGRLGVTLLQARLERESWIFRRQDAGGTDFGVDAEIEIVRRNKVTGRLFKGQIKATETIEWKENETGISIKVDTYNLWREMSLLTVLFLIDIRSGDIYWTPALAHHPAPERASVTIKFEQGSDIRNDITPLAIYLDSWFSLRGPESVSQEVPQFHQIFGELWSNVDHYDDPLEMHEDEHDRLRLFYQHMLRLRLDLGFRNDEVPALADWYARDAAAWQGSGILSWATFSELMKFTRPHYEEAIARLIERLESLPLAVENFWAKNLLAKLQGGTTTFSAMDPHANDIDFQQRFEAKLRSAGVVKYPHFDGRSA